VNGASLHTVIRVDNRDRATSDSITTSTAECADNRGVVLITVDGGGHEWPSFATAALWQFFATHAR
jgi:polyhydroxybutyrate depolymerase